MTTITTTFVKQNEKGFDLEFTLLDDDEEPVNLTGYSVVLFIMTLVGGSTPKVSSACSVTDAAAGQCKYIVLAGDMDTVGIYDIEVKVTYAGGAITKVPSEKDARIEVIQDLS